MIGIVGRRHSQRTYITGTDDRTEEKGGGREERGMREAMLAGERGERRAEKRKD